MGYRPARELLRPFGYQDAVFHVDDDCTSSHMPSYPLRPPGPDAGVPAVPQGQQHHSALLDRLLPVHAHGDLLVRRLPELRPLPRPHGADRLYDWLRRGRGPVDGHDDHSAALLVVLGFVCCCCRGEGA